MTYQAHVTEIAYRDSSRNSDKYYRAYTVYDEDTCDYRVVFQWGRQGARGQSQVVLMHDIHSATAAVNRKLADKQSNGYEPVYSKQLPGVSADILELAGLSADQAANVRSQQADPVKVLLVDIDTCRRLAMGDSTQVTEAVVMRRSLKEQLDALRSSVAEAEGQVEVVDMVLGAKLGV